jgi:hypothetical protein
MPPYGVDLRSPPGRGRLVPVPYDPHPRARRALLTSPSTEMAWDSTAGSHGTSYHHQGSWVADEIVPSGMLRILSIMARVEKVKPYARRLCRSE